MLVRVSLTHFHYGDSVILLVGLGGLQSMYGPMHKVERLKAKKLAALIPGLRL